MPHSPQRRNIHQAASPAGSHETGCTKSRPQTGQSSSPAMAALLLVGSRRFMMDAVSRRTGARPTGPPRVLWFGRPYGRVTVLRGLVGADLRRVALEARLLLERRVAGHVGVALLRGGSRRGLDQLLRDEVGAGRTGRQRGERPALALQRREQRLVDGGTPR